MRLKELRTRNNKKQVEVADYLGIKQNSYSQYETNKRKLTPDILIKLSKYYDVSVDYILELED